MKKETRRPQPSVLFRKLTKKMSTIQSPIVTGESPKLRTARKMEPLLENDDDFIHIQLTYGNTHKKTAIAGL